MVLLGVTVERWKCRNPFHWLIPQSWVRPVGWVY